ncbi:MAG: hypothetical protein M1814_001359 [Vezdaea aestivalis]|nr:MAG: hypothetical protein M1814_001359 [Vezdaea aestivalis]
MFNPYNTGQSGHQGQGSTGNNSNNDDPYDIHGMSQRILASVGTTYPSMIDPGTLSDASQLLKQFSKSPNIGANSSSQPQPQPQQVAPQSGLNNYPSPSYYPMASPQMYSNGYVLPNSPMGGPNQLHQALSQGSFQAPALMTWDASQSSSSVIGDEQNPSYNHGSLFDSPILDENYVPDQYVQACADKWLKYLEEARTKVQRHSKPRDVAIKVAILDTGIDSRSPSIQNYGGQQRIKKAESFLGPSTSAVDTHGHGTNCASMILRVATNVDLYVARVTSGNEFSPECIPAIVTAVKWAIKNEVDIISMSFGFIHEAAELSEALTLALRHRILLFAASTNTGCLEAISRSFPARMTGVICVDSCAGNGYISRFTADREEGLNNFYLLGEGIPIQEHQWVRKSGTSLATPIAAGVAALVLDFANQGPKLSEDDIRSLRTPRGMRIIFSEMGKSTNPPYKVRPWALFAEGKRYSEIKKTIHKALETLYFG